MQLTLRELFTAMHGMFFGGFFLLALFGLVVELIRNHYATQPSTLTPRGQTLERAFLIVTAALGWLAVFTGTYIVYPWYRSKPPASAAGLTAYPRYRLLSHPNTAAWHNIGMEWKEHIAFFAPIAITMIAYILIRQRTAFRQHPQARTSVLAFAVVAFVACGVASGFGAMIDKAAPVSGGAVFDLQLAAAMLANGVQRIYTYNTSDFEGFKELAVVEP